MNQNKDIMKIDPAYIIRRILQRWWVILALSVSMTLAVYMYQTYTYQPMYESSTIFVVNTKGLNSGINYNISSTYSAAKTFSLLLESSVLRRMMSEELGSIGAATTFSAKMVEETNMIELKVRSTSAMATYRTMRAILNNYDKVTDSAMGSVTLDILHPAEVPTKPYNAKTAVRNMPKTFAVSVALLAALIAVISQMRDTVRTEEEAESKIDTKLLGVIYHDKNGNMNRKSGKKNSMLITNPLLNFGYVESMKLTASRIRQQMDKYHCKSLMIASVAENEGKSTVAANIAISMAKEGKKVLLIDWDFRKPALYKIFDMKKENVDQMVSYLHADREEDYPIMKSSSHGLQLALNRQVTLSAGDMLTKEHLDAIIRSAESEPDYVIVDTAPLSLVSDSEIIAGICDASALVVMQDYVYVRDINDSLDALAETGTRVLGCILNNVKNNFGSQQQKYGYGGYYGKNSSKS